LTPMDRLKELYIETLLVNKGGSCVVIIAPSSKKYTEYARRLQKHIFDLTGVEVPCHETDIGPAEILCEANVIALGNMANNAFIAALYRKWYTLLDIRYPGKGGYVVRSLHNPLGTGHNVILLGGSDDDGVGKAAERFSVMLAPGSLLKVGWLMDVKLGEGVFPPDIELKNAELDVYSWRDSWRKTRNGKKTGYKAATYFGWNPISIAATLYYMTGESKYVDAFKEMALPDIKDIPIPNKKSPSFKNSINPLVENSHYRSHLVDCIWDLIEESPLFSDNERLRITNKLLEHQLHYDPNHSYFKPNGSRHDLWHMMCIYTGSRYFSKYYPNKAWDKRIENVRKAFSSFLGNPTWGERDTLHWISTSIEPIFEFFLMDGLEDFVKSGTDRTMMKALEILMTGEEKDDSNKYLSLSLLHKAAYITKETRYLWMADRLGFDYTRFRIGQSYLPDPDIDMKAPTDLIGKITVAPLAETDRVSARTFVPTEETFQILSYRTGLEKNDDYLLLDGFEGLGRHPYQLNSLYRLRMFGGKSILYGYANDLNVWYNGMTGAHVARSAALKRHLATKDFAYIETEVPDMPGSHWQRHIVYLKGRHAVVVDKLIPLEAGIFDVVSSWELGSKVKSQGKPSRRILTANGGVLIGADVPFEQLSNRIVRAKVSHSLGKDEPLVLANVLFSEARPKVISTLKKGSYLITGMDSGFVSTGPWYSPAFYVQASFSYIDRDKVLLTGATELSVKESVIFNSDSPVTVLWNLLDETAVLSASQPANVHLAVEGEVINAVVQAGEQITVSAVPQVDLQARIKTILKGLASALSIPPKDAARAAKPKPDWVPLWEMDLKGEVTAIALTENPEAQGIWAVSQKDQSATISHLAVDGRLLHTIRQAGEVLSIWPARSKKQSRAFSLLAGYKDDILQAFSSKGEELWKVKASIHPSFIIGDRYDAPWFTNPGPPNNMTGIYSVVVGDLWGTGQEEIAVGRPCTVEFRTLDGEMKASVPTRWGNNTALTRLGNSGFTGKDPIVIAGKAFTGNPQISVISKDHELVSDHMFSGILPGFTNMHAWLQRGMSELRVADLNRNGSEEVIYTLSGHWNELRVYSGDGKPLWMKFFGPGKRGEPFMTGLETADLTGDGRKEIIVGTKQGWVTTFDCQGNILWQRKFVDPITCLAASDEARKVVIGCEDGSLFLLNGTGDQRAFVIMEGAVRDVIYNCERVFAAGEKGLIQCLPGVQ